jgi:hypothetical protein
MSDNPYQAPPTSEPSAVSKGDLKDRILAWIVYILLGSAALFLIGFLLIALLVVGLMFSNM